MTIQYDSEPKLINAARSVDDRGVLTFCNEFGLAGVARFYMVRNHRRGFVRAWHGHATSGTFLWPVSGVWKVATVGDIDRLVAERDTKLSTATSGERPVQIVEAKPQRLVLDQTKILHVPGGWYHGHQSLTDGAILGVFSTATIEQARDDDRRLPWDQWPGVWDESFR